MRFKKYVTFLLIALAVGCKNKTSKTDNLFKFKDYISYTTSGVTSITKPIKLSLAKDVEDWEINKELTSDIISIKPHVEGKLTAVTKHTLVFTPRENLSPDTEYTVIVKLSKIYKDVPSDYKSYSFKFKTIKPSFKIETNNLQSYGKEWQYIEGVVKSSDYITLEQARQLISANQKGKKLNIIFNEVQGTHKVYEFKIDSINRQLNDSKIKVSWNGKAIKAKNKGENTLTIPGINNFTITKTEVVQSPEQYLSINFSDPLQKQQNFDGLVTLQKAKNLKYVVEGNVLKVYTNKKLVGNLRLDVYQGIKNTLGYKLKQVFSEKIAFESIKPQVRLINNGSILPNSQELKFNFEAVNLSAVDVRVIKIFESNVLRFLQDNNLYSNNKHEVRKVGRRVAKKTIQLQTEAENTGKWSAYSVDLSKFFNADPGAIYRIELSFNKKYALYDCSTVTKTTNREDNDEYYEEDYEDEEDYRGYSRETTIEDEELREEAYWDNLTNRYKYYRYNWREEKNPCHDAYYKESRTISQNLLASNLGVIAKLGTNKSYFFAVTNILSTEPEANAKVTLYNFQMQAIESSTTNKEGIVTIDADKHASFAVITKNNQSTYVRLYDGNALSLSKFDVSGNRLEKGLKGYIYGERGIWRPGDLLHLTFMLNDKANKLPRGHPVKMEVTDPNGKLVFKKVTTDQVNNFYKFTVPTAVEDKTGNYNAKVSVGGATFYKNLKIETVKPNRLKIKVDFEKEILTSNNPLNGTLDVKWLHGAPGKNLKAEIKAKFSTSYTAFKKYKDYKFIDPTRKFNTEEINVFEGKLNEEGKAKINTKLRVKNNAPGMLKVQFLARAFENGGDFSLDAFTKKYAPYTSFVGLRSPKGKAYGSYYTNENHTFDVVVVDAEGNPIKRNNLEVKIYKIKWRWWWSSSYDNLSSYISNSYHQPYRNSKISTNSAGKATLDINIPDDERGRYLIRIVDPVSGHATGRTAYFYKNWWQNESSGNKEAAKMLIFSADKEKYNVGDTAKITFQSGNEGRALVSIENGTEVIDHKWVKTNQGETIVEIPITSEMAPNVFINISLLQPHAITANDLPLRLYGVIPILVEDPDTKLMPKLKMPEVLQPEQEFEITVSEKNNKGMTYTIAVVEEGLLDLTRFKTPNAWSSFYAREALGVKTWDVFDDVIGAYSGSVDQVFAIGGDGTASEGKKKKANRFKPVVTYLGPFNLNSGQEQSHTIKLPNYIGAVRTMVVAGNNDKEAYGSTDKSVAVKKPLMVLASLPRKLSPGEKVTLPVTVFAMEPKVKNVKLSLKLSNGISIVGDTQKSLSFAKPDEQMAYFQLDVSKAKGINTIEVVASGNGEKSTYKVEIDVVNPNPISSQSLDSTLEAKASETIHFSTFGVYGTNSATVEFSTLPPMDFTRRLQYLIQYPHGCVEQTTSSVFPQLFLNDIFDLTHDKKQQIQENIEKGIKRLGHFQKSNGGLSYWIGENRASDWGTSYAGHFLIEAEKKGFVLPLTFKSNWISYQREAARSWRPSYKRYNTDLAQAYRLYTLALAGSPDLASMNRLREFSEISNNAKWRLAAAYALAGQQEASRKISQTANINFTSSRYNYYTYGSVDRNRAMALETMVLTKSNKRREIAEYMAKDLSSKRWMSTQTTAYSLLALAKMVKANGGKALHLEYSSNGKSQQINTQSAIAQRKLMIKEGENTLKLTNTNANLVYVRVLNSGKLPLGKELVEKRGLSVSKVYKDVQGNRIDISKLKQGQDFVATVKVSNLKNEPVKDVALTQIFPSGWEIVNTRFTDFGSTTTNQARFTDIRDDRVNFYFDLSKKGSKQETKTFNVMLNASYLGTYYLPGVQAEAMYDNEYLIRTKGQWVEIVK